LWFDVLFDGREGRSAARGGEVAGAPEDAIVAAVSQVREFFSEQSRRDSFERVHEVGDCDLRWIFDEEMHMVVRAIHFGERCSEVPAYVLEDAPHPFEMFRSEDATAVLRHEDQMKMNLADYVSAAPDVP
jgi:hypothetical protein